MSAIRDVSERVARKTSRRSFFGRGAELLFGALAGTAAGTALHRGSAGATHVVNTVCAFPGPPCPCDECRSNGVCAKPCVILTTYYATGCWVTQGVTCCDCDCPDSPFSGNCGCSTDYHQDPHNCPP